MKTPIEQVSKVTIQMENVSDLNSQGLLGKGGKAEVVEG